MPEVTTGDGRPEPPVRHRLELRLGIDPFWLSPLRALVTDVANRAEFDVDAGADLTMLVDELCSWVITSVPDREVLDCRFDLTADGVTVTVTPPAGVAMSWPDPDSFSWRVMCTLADDISPVRGEDGTTVAMRLTKLRLSPQR